MDRKSLSQEGTDFFFLLYPPPFSSSLYLLLFYLKPLIKLPKKWFSSSNTQCYENNWRSIDSYVVQNINLKDFLVKEKIHLHRHKQAETLHRPDFFNILGFLSVTWRVKTRGFIKKGEGNIHLDWAFKSKGLGKCSKANILEIFLEGEHLNTLFYLCPLPCVSKQLWKLGWA